MEVATSLPWPRSDLFALHPRRLLQLASAALERRADQIEMSMMLAAIPVELAFGVKDPTNSNRFRLEVLARRMRGHDTNPDEREVQGIMEVEDEMDRELPWSKDRATLNKLWLEHGQYGRVRKAHDEAAAQMQGPPAGGVGHSGIRTMHGQ